MDANQPIDAQRTRASTARRGGALLAVALLCAVTAALAQQQPAALAPAAAAPAAASGSAAKIIVKLVTDFETNRLVSDVESFDPVTSTVFGEGGSSTTILGEKCVLWVRNAHVDQKYFFERFYQDKYIGRKAELELDEKQLGPGEHVIEPGGHKFTLAEDGTIKSDDPDIRITGRTISLRLHQVTVYGVDGAKSGPAEFRKVPADVGLFSMHAGLAIDPAKLPDPSQTFDPQKPSKGDTPPPPLMNVVSHQKQFFPLSIWLPANAVGQGYLLYPSWQAFHVTPDGKVQLAAAAAPPVPGVSAEDAKISISYRNFSGRISTHSGLSGGVGSVTLAPQMSFGATIAPLTFRAGIGKPPEDFFLPVDNHLDRNPYKAFVADNTVRKEAVRLMAMEWERPVFVRGADNSLSLRLLETADQPTLKQPEVRVHYSAYDPSNPVSRTWEPVEVIGWQNGRDQGTLKFRAPDREFGFVALRVQIFDTGDPNVVSPLSAEITGCVIDRDQQGTASFVTNRGRNAFVAGEEIPLTLVFRSQAAREPGNRTVRLTHPDGHIENLTVADSGEAWYAASLRLAAERTRQLSPGRYSLTVADLPAGVVAAPLAIDIAGRQKSSLYHVVKPSKYTEAMNGLETGHAKGTPFDLDRAMRTLAELGYNRVDLMTYITNHHGRYYTWREELGAGDPRLPPPASVYAPSPRDQILNACVRNGLQYSDVWLTYNDFALPRYIDSYIHASERWMAREMQAMRHSPALDGMMLYDEMYQTAVTGIVEHHQKYFANVRARRLIETLGVAPSKIEEQMNRYLQRPRSQRDPAALEKQIQYRDWEQKGWADYVDRVVQVGKSIVPAARFGTYHRTWLAPGANDDIYNGYPPSLFKNLDIISHVHYADNSTCWVSIPLLAQALRTGQGKTLYINLPLTHEFRTKNDGQYQRQMAFALLAQGANGISQWGVPHSFGDDGNHQTALGRETTGPLNRDILQPFGEIVDRTRDGYRKIGIVSTLGQHALSEHKELAVANQTEGIWVACWRLGYPAVFLREEHMTEPLDGFSVIFVPGIRFDGELDAATLKRLQDAIAAGVKVVVEQDSVLDLPGIIKLGDWPLNSYYVGNYFPTWEDDELNKVYEKSQPIVDYLRPKFQQWNVEPAAAGPFKVGPTWRDGGDVDYLVMANFDDPDYGHTVKQQMARPVLMPLRIAATRGRVAYDLLAQQELKLESVKDESLGEQSQLTLDMRRMQGALVAFAPERIGKLAVSQALSKDGGQIQITATLVGESGQKLAAVFPARITLDDGRSPRIFYRMLGDQLSAEFDVPFSAEPRDIKLEVREALSGKSASIALKSGKFAGPTIVLDDATQPFIPYPHEVKSFLEQTKKVAVVPAKALDGVPQLADKLVGELKRRGIDARLADEESVYHQPSGDPQSEDPLGDGFHSWRGGQEIIAPATIVDEAVILLGGRNSSFLLDTVAEYGYVSSPPIGAPGQRVRGSVQLAHKALHYNFDTLCLIGNDADTIGRCVAVLLGELPKPAAIAAPAWAASQAITGDKSTPTTPAMSYAGTNEMVLDLKHDKAGNAYVITWGHGKNLYSFDPQGKLRFSRFLPEMGANRLDVYDDRLYVFTAAGGRLYQLGLDGQPLAQVRLNIDPGPTGGCDNYGLGDADFWYIPERHQLLHRMSDKMRVLDEQFQLVVEWPGETFFDKDVSDETFTRELHGYALSPDRQKIAQIESSYYFTKVAYQDVKVSDTHLVVRDLTGKLLAEVKDLDNRAANGGPGVTAQVSWPADAAGPVVIARDERIVFGPDLAVISRAPFVGGIGLGGERRLVRDGRLLVYYDTADHIACRMGPLATMPTYSAISPDGQHVALLDEYGQVSIFKADGGALAARFAAPELGQVVRFTPDSQRLVLAGFRGQVSEYDLAGKPLWQFRLSEANDILDSTLPLYDASIPDQTEKLWPVSRDRAGELDAMVRMDVNRLVGGDCETDGPWQGDAVAYAPEGFESARSLKVGPKMVTQEVTQFLGKHVTWVLEFQYRSAAGGSAELLAGVMSDGEVPDSTARRFQADGTWRFGRIVVKNGAACSKLVVGFAAAAGDVLVDQAQFRRIRFPSVNHLLYEPFYTVKPIVLDNPLFAQKYDPFGSLREQAPNRVLVENLKTGALNLVESTYLQNGRLNEIGSTWYIQPLMNDPLISVGLKEPQWISMVGLYFNVHDEGNVGPHVDIYAVDMETKKDVLVASVRHNGQLFRLIKFPPIKTPLVKIKQVHAISRLRTITEVELYGPLSGREGAPTFLDPEGQNTYMGDFTRVDKRVKKLSPQYQAPVSGAGGHGDEIGWFAPMTQILAGSNRLYFGRTFGKNSAYDLKEPNKPLYLERAGSIGYTPYGALYGGLIVRPGNDGKLYCINPETGTALWSVQLGERLFGCPVAIEEDLFVASDNGKLYQVDFASGSVMKETAISDLVIGSLATDGAQLYFITQDGYLNAYRVSDLTSVWKTPIAEFTDSTPAVDGGIVYVADQKGNALAVDAASGQVRWSSPLGDEFMMCPVVSGERIVFGCRGGTLAVLNRADGKPVWSKKVSSRFYADPLVVDDRVLYFPSGKAMLAALADGSEIPLTFTPAAQPNQPTPEPKEFAPGEPGAPVSFYQGSLLVVPRFDHSGYHVVYPWHVVGGTFHVLRPTPPPMEPTPAKEGK